MELGGIPGNSAEFPGIPNLNLDQVKYTGACRVWKTILKFWMQIVIDGYRTGQFGRKFEHRW